MLHADQQFAMTKQQMKKMQNHSTNLSGGNASDRVLSVGKDKAQHQQSASCTPYEPKGTLSGTHTASNLSANGSALTTPKPSKAAKQPFSKQSLTLSHTLTQGLGTKSNPLQPHLSV